MGEMQITPDEFIYFDFEWFKLNATIVNTWATMVILLSCAWFVRRKVTDKLPVPKFQSLLEILTDAIRSQIEDISQQSAKPFLPFVGTLFLFIATSNLLGIVPGFRPPTTSLSTTAALATSVFFAVPVFGIQSVGLRNYFGQYVNPSWLMLPFNIIGEFSRALALAVRLYGNMMSGAVIAAVLLTLVPLLVPAVMQLLGLITGMIQAYIFSILAMVYIASACSARISNTPRNSQVERKLKESLQSPKTSEEF